MTTKWCVRWKDQDGPDDILEVEVLDESEHLITYRLVGNDRVFLENKISLAHSWFDTRDAAVKALIGRYVELRYYAFQRVHTAARRFEAAEQDLANIRAKYDKST